MEGDILYETQSDAFTFDVRVPIFYNDAVEEIPLDFFSYDPIILDLSEDGGEALLRQHENRDDLAILNLKDGSTSQLEVELQEGVVEVSSTRFSSGDFLYIQHDDALWRYHPESKESEKILSDVRYYDILDDGRIVYSVSEEWDSFSLYSIKDDGSEKKLIVQGASLRGFDVNDDGTRLVYRQTLDSGYGWKSDKLQVVDLVTGDKHSVPTVRLSCGSTLMWAPGNDMIVYSNTGCGRGWTGGVLYISTIDGSYTEALIPSSNYRPQSVVSPDGSFLLSTSFGEDYSDPGYLYKIVLAKPIPEFQAATTMMITIMAVSVLPMIMFSKLRKSYC